MKFGNLKYGLLISATTFFGGSSFEMFAQTPQGHVVQMNDKKQYKQHFFEEIDPNKEMLKVAFMVDSVENMTVNGDLLADINVIELLAYLDPDGEEYQNYLANRHVVAHELWHRICLMNDVMEKPMSATQLRTELDNFEITANIVSVLTFRDDYIKATPKEREVLKKIESPVIRMYVQAIEHKIINPFSDDKKDFDFEMKFIASTVAQFWNNNMSESYALRHNKIVEQSGRNDFDTPVYQKNFLHDIKLMNTIGGIDFSKYYDYTDIHYRKAFSKGHKVQTNVLDRSLSAPDYETWINKKSRLKRYSKQIIEIPNFTGDRLKKERENRIQNSHVQTYEILPKASGYKVFPKLQTAFYAAAELKSKNTTLKFYPTGALDKIILTENKDVANIVTYNYDGSMEKGSLFKGKKNGTFVYFDKNKKEIARCVFKNGHAVDGQMVAVINDNYIYYHYKQGQITKVEVKNQDNQKHVASCHFEKGQPTDGLLVCSDAYCDLKFGVYQKGQLIAELELDKSSRISEKREYQGDTFKIERFYKTGEPLYRATLDKQDINEELYTLKGLKAAVFKRTPHRKSLKVKSGNLQEIVLRAAMPSQAKQKLLRSIYRPKDQEPKPVLKQQNMDITHDVKPTTLSKAAQTPVYQETRQKVVDTANQLERTQVVTKTDGSTTERETKPKSRYFIRLKKVVKKNPQVEHLKSETSVNQTLDYDQQKIPVIGKQKAPEEIPVIREKTTRQVQNLTPVIKASRSDDNLSSANPEFIKLKKDSVAKKPEPVINATMSTVQQLEPKGIYDQENQNANSLSDDKTLIAKERQKTSSKFSFSEFKKKLLSLRTAKKRNLAIESPDDFPISSDILIKYKGKNKITIQQNGKFQETAPTEVVYKPKNTVSKNHINKRQKSTDSQINQGQDFSQTIAILDKETNTYPKIGQNSSKSSVKNRIKRFSAKKKLSMMFSLQAKRRNF